MAVEVDQELVDGLAGPFPWIKLLSSHDQKACAREIVDPTRGSHVKDHPVRMNVEIMAWQNTAEAIGAGWNNPITDWLDEPVRVDRPLS
jgi:hypothetical protein